MCDRGKLKSSPLPSGVKIPDVKHSGGMAVAVKFRMQTSGWNGGGSRIPDTNIQVECGSAECNGGNRMKWRQSDGIPTLVEMSYDSRPSGMSRIPYSLYSGFAYGF